MSDYKRQSPGNCFPESQSKIGFRVSLIPENSGKWRQPDKEMDKRQIIALQEACVLLPHASQLCHESINRRCPLPAGKHARKHSILHGAGQVLPVRRFTKIMCPGKKDRHTQGRNIYDRCHTPRQHPNTVCLSQDGQTKILGQWNRQPKPVHHHSQGPV